MLLILEKSRPSSSPRAKSGQARRGGKPLLFCKSISIFTQNLCLMNLNKQRAVKKNLNQSVIESCLKFLA